MDSLRETSPPFGSGAAPSSTDDGGSSREAAQLHRRQAALGGSGGGEKQEKQQDGEGDGDNNAAAFGELAHAVANAGIMDESSSDDDDDDEEVPNNDDTPPPPPSSAGSVGGNAENAAAAVASEEEAGSGGDYDRNDGGIIDSIVGRNVDITNNKYQRTIAILDPHEFDAFGHTRVFAVTPSQIDVAVETNEQHPHPPVLDFVIERIVHPSFPPGYVAIRASGHADLYLTAVPYGDGPRKKYASILGVDEDEGEGESESGSGQSSNLLQVLPRDVMGRILDLLVHPASSVEWIEGPNFHYDPITAQRGGPMDTSKMFRLTDRDHRGVRCLSGTDDEWGIRTYHGAYLRAFPTTAHVSQSPLCEDDEKWEILSMDDSDSDEE